MIIDFHLPEDLLFLLKKISTNSEKEVCGFICLKNNDYIFIEKDNLHPDPKRFFLINPKDNISEKGTLLFHSHPLDVKTEGFSEWDLENQEYFRLPMLLYSVNKDEFYFKNI